MSTGTTVFDIVTFYRFTTIAAPASLRNELMAVAEQHALRGTIAIAGEGINATIAGRPAGIAALLDALRAHDGFAGLRPTLTRARDVPFRRLKIRVRRELLGFGQSGINPAVRSATPIAPAAWNELVAREDVVLIDARNDYEVALGTFQGAKDPRTADFRDFPERAAAMLDPTRDRHVAMFCTGGIRCEKASAYLLEQGFSNVYQLDGGILRYLAEVPAGQSRWQGDCFVFDERVALDQNLRPADYVQCGGCRRPLDAAARRSPHYVEGIACAHCHAALDAEKRQARAERKRQIDLAAARGERHLGGGTGGSVKIPARGTQVR